MLWLFVGPTGQISDFWKIIILIIVAIQSIVNT